jgi:hypothetical protein
MSQYYYNCTGCTALNERVDVMNAPASYFVLPGSHLSLVTGYPDGGFSWFSSDPPGKFWESTLN